ncbi:DUF4184 family protein [Quadrisphaera setariae]|uniref:DUF4184 family protein n=1 Tax=Quadrisphaera setariae TaxID=2593304 RepID=A0A5C8Z6C3_9ACTN|nr:DUF4184 family protein [Quadrisphaera setariae]TXR52849.1 DUF4184 family protein [Quadrisphaera setariae]
MPFTPAHAAAALPLLRTPLPASALVIGTLTPDLPYYTPAGTSWDTHSPLSLVTTDLALGLVAWAVWHSVLAPAAVAASPAGLRARSSGGAATGLRRRLASPSLVAWTLLALVVGAATHVGWDELTHPGRWGTAHLAVLREPVGPLEGYRWAQYGSGLLGLVVLALWALRWWRRTPPAPLRTTTGHGPTRSALLRSPSVVVLLALFAVAAVAGCTAAALAPDLRAAAFAGATVGGGAAASVALVGALVWRVGGLRAR